MLKITDENGNEYTLEERRRALKGEYHLDTKMGREAHVGHAIYDYVEDAFILVPIRKEHVFGGIVFEETGEETGEKTKAQLGEWYVSDGRVRRMEYNVSRFKYVIVRPVRIEGD